MSNRRKTRPADRVKVHRSDPLPSREVVKDDGTRVLVVDCSTQGCGCGDVEFVIPEWFR